MRTGREGQLPLLDDLSGAHGIMADLAVAHVGIAGQAHGRAVRLDGAPAAGRALLQALNGGALRIVDGIELVLPILAPPVQHHEQKRLPPGHHRVRVQLILRRRLRCHHLHFFQKTTKKRRKKKRKNPNLPTFSAPLQTWPSHTPSISPTHTTPASPNPANSAHAQPNSSPKMHQN